jgi:hypothetical protein
MGSSKGLFAPMAKHYGSLIETGTWMGDGIQIALESGFGQVISCDINEEFVLQARLRFKNDPVTVHCGSSEQVLKSVVREVAEPAIFFLDAHAMPPSPAAHVFSASTLVEGQEQNEALQCPILAEIDIILEGGFMGHAIFVDDRQCFDTWLFHFLSEQMVRQKVSSLCPGKYSFGYYQNVLCITPRGVKKPREPLRTTLGRQVRRLAGS